MWDEPYLETCCRSALHRLALCGAAGRPSDMKDTPCLTRLEQMGLVVRGGDGRFRLTLSGEQRHLREILHGSA